MLTVILPFFSVFSFNSRPLFVIRLALEFLYVYDKSLVCPFADETSLIIRLDGESDPSPVDFHDLAFGPYSHSDRSRRTMTDIDMGAD